MLSVEGRGKCGRANGRSGQLPLQASPRLLVSQKQKNPDRREDRDRWKDDVAEDAVFSVPPTAQQLERRAAVLRFAGAGLGFPCGIRSGNRDVFGGCGSFRPADVGNPVKRGDRTSYHFMPLAAAPSAERRGGEGGLHHCDGLEYMPDATACAIPC